MHCYQKLHPGIMTELSRWSVSAYAYRRPPAEEQPFTVIRRRSAKDERVGRDEIYWPHLSGDHQVWEWTPIMVEEARDGSSYDVRRITEAEAEEIMARTRTR